MRLYRRLDVPTRFQSILEDLNPADTAARYPDAADVDFERPTAALDEGGELLQWIQRQFDG